MVAGIDRYFQIARCFRDEDLRGDRQPEFTQLDLEMSFVDEDAVMGFVEAMVIEVSRARARTAEPEVPFPRFTFDEAMERFGSDKPDLRFGMELVDLGAGAGGRRAPAVSGCSTRRWRPADGSRRSSPRAWRRRHASEIDELTELAKRFGAKGLAHLAVEATARSAPDREVPVGDDAPRASSRRAARPRRPRADRRRHAETTAEVLGRLRVELGARLGLADPNVLAYVLGPPLPDVQVGRRARPLGRDPQPVQRRRAGGRGAPRDGVRRSGRPSPEDPAGRARALQYDVALNGWELGGGSVRIHRRDLLERSFALQGHTLEGMREKFGAMLEAFEYGAPPHGGIALGIDRWAALLADQTNIREVMAFPKTQSGTDLMLEAPSPPEPGQYEELGLRFVGRARADRREAEAWTAGRARGRRQSPVVRLDGWRTRTAPRAGSARVAARRLVQGPDGLAIPRAVRPAGLRLARGRRSTGAFDGQLVAIVCPIKVRPSGSSSRRMASAGARRSGARTTGAVPSRTAYLGAHPGERARAPVSPRPLVRLPLVFDDRPAGATGGRAGLAAAALLAPFDGSATRRLYSSTRPSPTDAVPARRRRPGPRRRSGIRCADRDPRPRGEPAASSGSARRTPAHDGTSGGTRRSAIGVRRPTASAGLGRRASTGGSTSEGSASLARRSWRSTCRQRGRSSAYRAARASSGRDARPLADPVEPPRWPSRAELPATLAAIARGRCSAASRSGRGWRRSLGAMCIAFSGIFYRCAGGLAVDRHVLPLPVRPAVPGRWSPTSSGGGSGRCRAPRSGSRAIAGIFFAGDLTFWHHAIEVRRRGPGDGPRQPPGPRRRVRRVGSSSGSGRRARCCSRCRSCWSASCSSRASSAAGRTAQIRRSASSSGIADRVLLRRLPAAHPARRARSAAAGRARWRSRRRRRRSCAASSGSSSATSTRARRRRAWSGSRCSGSRRSPPATC